MLETLASVGDGRDVDDSQSGQNQSGQNDEGQNDEFENRSYNSALNNSAVVELLIRSTKSNRLAELRGDR